MYFYKGPNMKNFTQPDSSIFMIDESQTECYTQETKLGRLRNTFTSSEYYLAAIYIIIVYNVGTAILVHETEHQP